MIDTDMFVIHVFCWFLQMGRTSGDHADSTAELYPDSRMALFRILVLFLLGKL